MDIYVIESESGVHYGTCLQGKGSTPEEAWLDALGPKPWSSYQKRLKKQWWVRKLEPDETQE